METAILCPYIQVGVLKKKAKVLDTFYMDKKCFIRVNVEEEHL